MKISTKRKLQIGASLVEYGLLVALIAVVSITAVRKMGRATLCKNCYISYAMRVRCGQSLSSVCMGGINYQRLWVDGCVNGTGATILYNICRNHGGRFWTWQ